MNRTTQISEKTTGALLVTSAFLLFIPYTLLSIYFDYPGILREDAGTVLTRFHEGGAGLIWIWFVFALVGLPLIPAYIMLGQRLERRLPFMRWATFTGTTGLVVQMIGLLRWTFVVPVLANNMMEGDAATQAASKVAFQIVHQYGGVILGEHLGQLFTIVWTAMTCLAFVHLKLLPKWLTGLGFLASGIYLLAQAELFATVMPGFPVWDLAGFLGSTLWLVWLILLGFRLRKLALEE